MKILIGCEFTGIVRDQFAALGHNAWSCDLTPSEKPGQHLQCDIFEALCSQLWDAAIIHPPCTKIAVCSNRHYGATKPRHIERVEAISWTKKLWTTAKNCCEKVAMENPKNVMGRHIGKPQQVIHPWQFGHPEQKTTWLWLHGLPKLVPTQNVFAEMMRLPKRERQRIFHMQPSETRGRDRSRTYPGIAIAMAAQWGK